MIENIGLSLSCTCSANCVFCPSDRGLNCKTKIMPFSVAKKVIDDCCSSDFKKVSDLKVITFSENGDCFTNKEIIRILRYAKNKLPNVERVVYTNFFLLNPDLSKIIISEGLIDKIYCNIDSVDPVVYYNIKGLNFGMVWNNFINFIKLRDESRSDININVAIVDMVLYKGIVNNLFNRDPSKFVEDKNYCSKVQNVGNLIFPLLNSVTDNISSFKPIIWAERNLVEENPAQFNTCPNIEKIQKEIYVNSDGNLYLCCFDSANKLITGNVNENSLFELVNNDKRKNFIELLKRKKYKKIGSPCTSVMCCNIFDIEKNEGDIL